MKYATPFADVLPPLSESEFESLRADIALNGVLNPILVDEEGNVLDGHHRLKLDPNVKANIVKGLSELEKKAFVMRSNLGRRNLSAKQKKELLKRQRLLAAELNRQGLTQEQIASALGVARRTVGSWLRATNGTIANGCIDGRVKLPREEIPKIMQRLAAGDTQEEIAATYGITRQALSKMMKQQHKKTKPQPKDEDPPAKKDPPRMDPDLIRRVRHGLAKFFAAFGDEREKAMEIARWELL